MQKSRLVLNRPVFVGMCFLDLSKHLMYDLCYNKLQRQYGGHCQLLYMDTDNHLLEIDTEDMVQNRSRLYDTSDYPKVQPLHSVANRKVLGKLKDECAGRAIAEYVSLRKKRCTPPSRSLATASRRPWE